MSWPCWMRSYSAWMGSFTLQIISARFHTSSADLTSSAPARWYYDVLRALEYFRFARPGRDPRCADAVELLRSKRLPNGLFLLENTHQGPTLFGLEAESEGFPSRWVTLRALRVLRWWDGG